MGPLALVGSIFHHVDDVLLVFKTLSRLLDTSVNEFVLRNGKVAVLALFLFALLFVLIPFFLAL